MTIKNSEPPKLSSDRFWMLDLMRGIAAIAVLIYHDENFLGVQLLPNAYLAVDMFFLLSGFVIAHNYDSKIASGMSLTEFLVQRLIRLYPCFILTLLMGVGVFALRMIRETGHFDAWRLVAASGLNAMFLPTIVWPYGFKDLFPFDGAAWSLTFELIANAIYCIAFRYLDRRRVALLVLSAAAVLSIPLYFNGSIDVGMRPSDFWWGIPRVVLTFFIGVALRRYFYGRVRIPIRHAAAAIVLLSLVLGFSVSRFFSAQVLPTAEFLLVGGAFPLLLLSMSEIVPTARTARICKWVGDASYPVYLLQNPFIGLFAGIPQLLFNVRAVTWAPWIGIAHVVATIVCALWIDRYYELPLRKMLKKRWLVYKAAVNARKDPARI